MYKCKSCLTYKPDIFKFSKLCIECSEKEVIENKGSVKKKPVKRKLKYKKSWLQKKYKDNNFKRQRHFDNPCECGPTLPGRWKTMHFNCYYDAHERVETKGMHTNVCTICGRTQRSKLVYKKLNCPGAPEKADPNYVKWG